MKTIQEQIEVMQHFANDGEVEYNYKNGEYTTLESEKINWNWNCYDYRIKEQKKAVVIEKWLCKHRVTERYEVIEGNELFYKDYGSKFEQIKLLETYEVEL